MLKTLGISLVILAQVGLSPEPPRNIMRNLLTNLSRGVTTACQCQLEGISVSRWHKWPDTTGWRIDFKEGTTQAQMEAGIAFMRSFDPTKAENRQ